MDHHQAFKNTEIQNMRKYVRDILAFMRCHKFTNFKILYKDGVPLIIRFDFTVFFCMDVTIILKFLVCYSIMKFHYNDCDFATCMIVLCQDFSLFMEG
jgi:uncharacterized membrane protein